MSAERWIEIGASRRYSASRRAPACRGRARRCRSRCSAPPTDEIFALVDRCPHRGGPLSEGIVSGPRGRLPAAQLGDRARQTASPRRPTKGSTRSRAGQARGRPDLAAHAGARHLRSLGPHDRRCADPHDLSLLRRRLRRARGAGRRPIAGDPEHPANFGRLCSKGAALGETLATAGRLLRPQIARPRRRAGTRRSILVAERFARTIAEHGPDAVAFYVSGQFLTEDYYVANKLMKGFIGSGNIDTNSRLCMASSVAGHIRAFGEDIVPGCYDDLEEADLVVLVGSNMAWCHPVLYQRLMRGARSARHQDRRHRSAPHRDLRDRRPASGAARRAAMSRCSPACSRISPTAAPCDRDWIARARTGFAEALAAARGRRRRSKLLRARRPAGAPTSPAFYDWFAATERVGDALFAGREPVRRRHRQGQRDHQLPPRDRPDRPARHGAVLADRAAQRDGRARGRRPRQPARRAYGLRRPRDIDRVRRFWDAPRLATRPGLKAVELFDAVLDGRVKALWILGTNPADSMPRAGRVRDGAGRAARLSWSAIAGRPTRRGLPMSCCRPPAGARRTAPSPIPSAASRASARFARRPARRARIGGCSREVARRMGWGRGVRLSRPGRHFPRARRAVGIRERWRARISISAALADLSDDEYDRLQPVQWPVPAARAGGRGGCSTPADFPTHDGRARLVPHAVPAAGAAG